MAPIPLRDEQEKRDETFCLDSTDVERSRRPKAAYLALLSLLKSTRGFQPVGSFALGSVCPCMSAVTPSVPEEMLFRPSFTAAGLLPSWYLRTILVDPYREGALNDVHLHQGCSWLCALTVYIKIVSSAPGAA